MVSKAVVRMTGKVAVEEGLELNFLLEGRQS
jgi:hypothetical protein